MTWQLASFVLLALALGAGFAWYERARPSAKVLALVATLAALAALGRIAFAPLPSVKPTTDIVLLSGYVLGGAPGFAVGSVAALASNVFFGQGPFTPWQMAAWGGVGVFGALLARVFGRELGRWSLAAACAVAGLAYGAFLDLHLWVMYSGEHSLNEYLVMAGRGLPFNLGHAAGNVVFCLAFGPLLARALQRYRDRLDVTWKPLSTAGAGAGSAAVAVAAVLLALGALATPPPASAADRNSARAITYLAEAQNTDGGFGGDAGRASSQLHTSWAVLGLKAAGRDPNRVRRNGRSPVDYIVRGIGRVRGIGDIERTILALRAAGRSVRSVGGRDLVRELIRGRRRDGSFAGLVNQTAFAILALRAAGRSQQRPHGAQRRGLAHQPAQPRRRLQLRRQGRAQRDRRHGSRGPGAGRRRQARLEDGEPCRVLPRRSAERRRRHGADARPALPTHSRRPGRSRPPLPPAARRRA